jgi:hypothetical protein
MNKYQTAIVDHEGINLCIGGNHQFKKRIYKE